MLKKYFELLLVVGVLFLIIYFFFYMFFLDKICSKYSSDNNLTQENIIYKTSSCKDILICDLNGIELDNNEVVSWNCEKKKIFIYELDFYINEFKKIID